MKRILFFMALAVLSLLSIISCSNDDNEDNDQFKTISYQVIHHLDSLPFFRTDYTLSYNQDGFLTRKEEKHYLMDDDGSWLYIILDVCTVSYDKSAFKATLTENRLVFDDPISTDLLVLSLNFDDSWKIISRKEKDDKYVSFTYTYHNDGCLSKISTIDDDNSTISENYTWENGNLISKTSFYDDLLDSYAYSDEPNPFCDAIMDPITDHWLIMDDPFRLGLDGKRLVHLPISLTQYSEEGDPNHFYFDYKKDSQGRIIEIDSWHENDKSEYAAIYLNY